MKILTTILLLVAILIMFLSILRFVKIKKQLKETLFCSDLQTILISNSYIVLLGFFLMTYIVYTIIWSRTNEYTMFSYMIMLLLFFGSVFVGISTLFLYHFVSSVLNIKLNQTDVMTGLITKTGIELMANNILKEGSGDYVFAIMDLDNFKQVNDRYGHTAGDELIALVADIICQTVRGDDAVGRFGGDEYLIILKNIQIENAEKIMNRIQNSVLEAIAERDYTVCTGISFGMTAMKGGSHKSYKEIFDQADAQLYQYKKIRKQGGKLL